MSSGELNDAFMQLLLAELQNQDPLNPVEDTEFISQLTQLNMLQAMEQLNYTMGIYTVSSSLMQGTALIGRTVEALDANGETITGVVTAVSLVNGIIMLELGETSVPLGAVLSIREAETHD
jgi:flagellar basal-body rod modification protein FlgD